MLLSSQRADAAIEVENLVRAKLGGRLRGFHIDDVGGQWVLSGLASTYHVKQLAQQEVMVLTGRTMLANTIEVATL